MPIISSINIQDTDSLMDCAIIEGTLLMEQMRVVPNRLPSTRG